MRGHAGAGNELRPRAARRAQDEAGVRRRASGGLYGNALLVEEGLQFAGLEHLAHDVAAADELALHVELRDRRPVRVVLYPLAQIGGGEHVDALVVDAEVVEDLDDLAGEAALRKARG